jgi:hypothetical protein
MAKKTVTLPPAAANMADVALSHVPEGKFVFSSEESDSQHAPLDHVPDHAVPHVPTQVPPPITLPDAATGHLPDVAIGHLPSHIDWDI